MKETLFALLVWINQNTGFNYNPQQGLPDVKQVSAEELVNAAFKGEVPAYLSGDDLEQFKQSLTAIYHHEQEAIYVRSDVDLNDPYGTSVLLHELIHFVQHETGVADKAVCPNELESAAYKAQKVYMLEKGLEPDFDDFTIAIRSMCWEY